MSSPAGRSHGHMPHYVHSDGSPAGLDEENAPGCCSRFCEWVSNWTDCLNCGRPGLASGLYVAAMVAGWMLFGGGIALITIYAAAKTKLFAVGIGMAAAGLGSIFYFSLRHLPSICCNGTSNE